MPILVLGAILISSPSVFAAISPLSFTVNMSENVVVNTTGGAPTIAIDVGSVPHTAVYAAGSTTNALTFTYTPTAGDVDLDGITLTSPITVPTNSSIKDTAGNDADLTFTAPNTSGIKINYPSLSMDFVYDADGRYTLNGNPHDTLSAFLADASGSFTRGSIGTYFDSAGVLQTASANTPRFDHDPVTHAAKGILIEEQKTNSIRNSTMAGVAVGAYANNSGPGGAGGSKPTNWANYGTLSSGLTAYISAAGTEYGMNYIDYRIAGTSSVANSFGLYVDQNITAASSGQTWTFSCYAKLINSSGAYNNAVITNVARNAGGTVTNSQTQNLTTLSTTLSRFTTTLTITDSTTATTNGAIGISYGTGAVDATIRIYAPQLEQGAFSTSYIPTTTAAVTRVSDVLTVPTGGWYSNSAFTLTSIVNQNSLDGSTSYPATWALNDGTLANEIQLYTYTGTGAKVSNVKGVQSNVNLYEKGIYISSSLPNTIKSAVTFGSGTFAGVANGGTVYPYSGSAPSGISSLQIGASRNGTANRINSSIAKLNYYPLRVSDTQLQLLTQ